MTITALTTFRSEEHPNMLWLEVETGDGVTGLGETFYAAEAVEAYVHANLAPIVLGLSAIDIEAVHHRTRPYIGFVAASTELRARSALDIALWDALGKVTGQPVSVLLGGRVREQIPVYNTCAGTRYVRGPKVGTTENFGLRSTGRADDFEDLHGFLNDPVGLAGSLLDMGIDSMKIWSFDFAAEATQGQFISPAELAKGLAPFKAIRKAYGDRMQLSAELHGMWNLPESRVICQALDEIGMRWIEDPVLLANPFGIAQLKGSVRSRLAMGETRGGAEDFKIFLDTGALSLLILDIGWCGGLTEARRCAALAGAYLTPVAAHDCNGPVVLSASVHFCQATTNAYVQEIVRAFYYGWYADIVTALPPVEDGRITTPEGPGLGMELLPDFKNREGTTSRVSHA
ncbi:MAG: mandelate racemase/muconate lactonizing enzyme family protein [Pseudomonadota bacterium]|nr:mandelate racemase/muconate lactonizing enzyme family protein [Pseudomonadota bacterium]